MSEAKASNTVATSVLLAEKELAVFKYYGVSAYTRDRILPYFNGLINKSLSSSQNDNYTTRDSSNRRTAKVAFMITKDQRKALNVELGYSEDQIKKLKPMEALLILEHRVPPNDMKSNISTLIKSQEQQPVLLKENSHSLSRSDNVDLSSLPGKTDYVTTTTSSEPSSHDDSVKSKNHSEISAVSRRQWFKVIEVQNGVNVTVGMYHDESEAQLCLEAKEHLAAKHRPDENIQFKVEITTK